MKKMVMVILMALAFAKTASADQCKIVSEAQATLAKQVIEAQALSRIGSKKFADLTEMILFCDSCTGSKKESILVSSVEVVNMHDGEDANLAKEMGLRGEYKVVVKDSNGKRHELDLAYSFLGIGKGTSSVRLAPLAGCEYSNGLAEEVL